MKLFAVVFTGSDEMTTKHSAHLKEEDAWAAGAALARRVWAIYQDEDGTAEPFPSDLSDGDAVDYLRTGYHVSLEIEPIEIHADVIRAAYRAL